MQNACYIVLMNMHWKKFIGFDSIEAIDLVFADFVCRRAGSFATPLQLTALLASRSVRMGEVGFSLRRFAGREFPLDHPEAITLPALEEWRVFLSGDDMLPAVSREPDVRDTPLVLTRDLRVALHRYYRYETELFQQLRCRAALPPDLPDIPAEWLTDLSPYFASARARCDLQLAAVLTACTEKLSVITGGPGTGKSTVVGAILKLMLRLRPDCRIALSAPTGKAQARLAETAGTPPPEQVRCMTLHRLLGLRPGSAKPRYSPENKLPVDLLVLDELSMVGLPLLAKLFAALPDDCRVVLLGDGEQLPAIELGGALRRILEMGEPNHMRPETADLFERLSGFRLPEALELMALDGHIIELKHNYRSASAPTIVRAATLIRERAPADEIIALMTGNESEDLIYRPLPEASFLPELLHDFMAPVREALRHATSPRESLEIIDRSRVLSPLRNGRFGVESLQGILRRIMHMESEYAHQMPVMILENAPSTNLSNGDVGMIWRENERIEVYFRFGEELRCFHPVELPAHECALAMTVHKSQGSGFDRVLALIPEDCGELLSRELIYTALTRAGKKLTLLTTPEALKSVF